MTGAEEGVMYESEHTSLDWAWGGSVTSSQWKKASKADNKFISQYTKRYPNREDFGETINWWIAVRRKSDKIYNLNYKKIVSGITERLKYLDEQDYDTYPSKWRWIKFCFSWLIFDCDWITSSRQSINRQHRSRASKICVQRMLSSDLIQELFALSYSCGHHISSKHGPTCPNV